MKITNITANPRYFSYASVGQGGRTLQSGAASPELPFSLLADPQLWRDIDGGLLALRLSPADKQLMRRISEQEVKPIKVAKLPPKPKVVRRAYHKDPIVPQRAKIPGIPMNHPGMPKGVPDLSGISAVPRAMINPNLPPSLGQLKDINAALKRQKLADVQSLTHSLV